MAFAYSEMDKLIIERWHDVVSLIEAHRSAQDRIEEMIKVVGERIARWARPLGYETEVSAKDAEFRAWRPNWAEKRRGPKVKFAVGGFCPAGFRKIDAPYPYLWVYTDGLAEYKMKDAERAAFAHGLRTALGDQARSWEADGVDEADGPLGRYLTHIDNAERSKIISTPENLFDFVTANLDIEFAVGDVIQQELGKVANGGRV